LFLVALAEGELDHAVNIHQETIPILKEFPPLIYQRYLADCIDRIIRLHRLQPAEKQWIQELHLWLPSFEAQIGDIPNSRQEPQLLVKAKALAETGNLEESLSLLEYLANAAEPTARVGDLIQYRVRQSLVLEQLSRREAALACLEEAVSLAASENFIRTFLDDETDLAQLIYLLPESPYRNEIVSNFRQMDRSTLTSSSIASGDFSIVDPLSERELEVLSLLATHLSGPEIADRLNISINTYKTHAKNIYGKLGVSSRNKAVVNARALGLL
jgi:LuxR family maltose regulon positive regulatory protein